jgi:glycosyltransferase involved in cell wall biosynthesis
MSDSNPKISVIMPVYNCYKYIGLSIQSILNQSEANFEFIIIDDGSTEPIASKVQFYARLDSRIIFISEKENKGLTYRLNQCLDIAKGIYIARMDGDDISSPLRFEKQLKLFREGIGFVGCWGKSIDINGNDIIGFVDLHCKSDDKDLLTVYPKELCMIDASVIYTKEASNRIGYYDKDSFNCESYNYIRRMQKYYKGRICKEVLYIRRVGSSTAPRRNDITNIFEYANKRATDCPIIKEY